MFDRALYKKTARQQLKRRWAFPVLMSLIVCALSTLLGVIDGGGNYATTAADGFYAVSAWGSAFTIPIICIMGILMLAQAHVYLRIAKTTEKVRFDDFLSGLAQWLSGALAGLWYALWVFLWSLLFVIPGIIKAIAYSQLFFVLAENKGIGVRKAMHISKIMTQGHKGDLFVLALSFFGWAILSTLTGGIGYLWLIPYMMQSYTNAYFALKNMAIMTGKLSPADFATSTTYHTTN